MSSGRAGAFDKLHSSESILPMYCETILLKLLPIATNMPVATFQESNLHIKDLQADVWVSCTVHAILEHIQKECSTYRLRHANM